MTTQAQIDALKSWYAQGAPLINALTPDTAPQPPSDWGTVAEYDNSFFGAKAYKMVAVSANGQPYAEPRPVWGTNPTATSHPGASPLARPGDITGTIDWSPTAREFHRITPFMNTQWLFIDGFGSVDGQYFWPLETIRADWVNLSTGQDFDITPQQTGRPNGQPYMPAQVFASGHWKIRVWFWIWNGMPPAGRSGLAYWEAEFTYGTSVLNVAWKGDSHTTRQVIRLEEGWWNGGHTGAWTDRCTGTPPYDAHDNPIIPVTQYTGYNCNARGAGTMWVYSYAPNVAGIESMSNL